jgi:DNA helicase-2/ATP-dependent DNA helicase PcrA
MTPTLCPGDLRDLLDVPFTAEQLAAATAPLAPALVVAGAGSGKTSVMAARVVWLVGTGQVRPEQVLGLTFTTKAAAELAQRVDTALLRAELADTEQAGAPVVSTYHAFAGRLLSEHALRLGVEPRSRLLADATRYQLAGRVLRDYAGPLPTLTRPLRMLVGDLVALDSELSEHLVTPERLDEFDAELLTAVEQAVARARDERCTAKTLKALQGTASSARQRRELTQLVVALRAEKRRRDAIDFGDQVAFAARLARDWPEIGERERSRSAVVLLDEYQDTSVAQRQLLAGLFGGGHPVTAVGDPAQAIYGWRGASVSNLAHFPEHFPSAAGTPALTYPLGTNMRSGGRLLRLANRLADPLRSKANPVVELRPRPHVAEQGETVVALHRSWEDELAWVAQSLRTVVDTGVAAPGGCAVLVRARSDIAALYAALTGVGLPVEVVGLGGLLAVPEVADVVALLEVLDSPTANAALLRLLTGPRWRLGARDLAALGRRARQLLADPRATDPATAGQAGVVDEDPGAALEADDRLDEAVAGVDPCDVVSLADALSQPGGALSPEARRRALLLAAELRELRTHVEAPLLDLVQRIVETTGLDVELSASPGAVAARRRDTLAAFLDVVAGFTDLDGEQSLGSFLAFLDAAQEHERGLDAATPGPARASVQLLTVHKAKGLEWDVVALPDLTKGVFPIDVSRDRWTSAARTLPLPLREDRADLPAVGRWDEAGLADYDAACAEHLEREERRLAYVAVTRARHLVLASGHWWGPTQVRPRGPSAYLLELKRHVEAGHGRLELWTEAPAESRNPLLAGREALAWPPPYDPAGLAARQAAAAAVRAGMARLAAADSAAERPADGGVTDEGLTEQEGAFFGQLDREAELLLAEARRAGGGSQVVALPRTLTASQLVLLHSEPDRLAHELARPLPRRPAPAARRGTRFHAWVEARWGQRPLLGPDELPGAEDTAVGDDAELTALQQAFLATPYADRVPHAVEVPFAVALGGRVVRGRIDAVYELGGGRWEVVDWKTGDEQADPWQLGIYRLAWARLRGVDASAVDAVFLYVRSGSVVRPEAPDEPALLAALGVR